MTAWSLGPGLSNSLVGSSSGGSGFLVARGSTPPTFLLPCPLWWRASSGPAPSVLPPSLPFPCRVQMPAKKGLVWGERWPRP